MEWISIKNQSPPSEPVLVFGTCGSIHATIFANGGHYHAECCYADGGHFEGEEIEFTHWMHLPIPPVKCHRVAESDGICFKCKKHVMEDCECFFGKLFLKDKNEVE